MVSVLNWSIERVQDCWGENEKFVNRERVFFDIILTETFFNFIFFWSNLIKTWNWKQEFELKFHYFRLSNSDCSIGLRWLSICCIWNWILLIVALYASGELFLIMDEIILRINHYSFERVVFDFWLELWLNEIQ